METKGTAPHNTGGGVTGSFIDTVDFLSDKLVVHFTVTSWHTSCNRN